MSVNGKERHNYEYQVSPEADSAPARVIRMVGTGKRVLEMGAGPGSITKLLSSASGCRVTALEIDQGAIEKLRAFCDSVYQADLNQEGWPSLLESCGRFDVVVAADVLEHVYEPLSVLREMRRFLSEDGYIVISLPHVGHSAVHACLMDEDFAYGNYGLLDRTHIRFFGIRNMQRLLEDAGLKAIHAEFVVRQPEHTEFAAKWSRLPAAMRDMLAKNRHGTVYQVVVKAIPVHVEGRAVSLMEIPVETAPPSVRASLGSVLRTILGEKMYSKLRLLASKMGVAIKG
jgi:2-polyprenyl-3-methyl-5-hydroxy-6-metoxy-1,4-benzoquinol methylase